VTNADLLPVFVLGVIVGASIGVFVMAIFRRDR
jgi:hypothetical protein